MTHGQIRVDLHLEIANPKLFKEICLPVFNSRSIDIEPKDDLTYGIVDINEKIIKTYELLKIFRFSILYRIYHQ